MGKVTEEQNWLDDCLRDIERIKGYYFISEGSRKGWEREEVTKCINNAFDGER